MFNKFKINNTDRVIESLQNLMINYSYGKSTEADKDRWEKLLEQLKNELSFNNKDLKVTSRLHMYLEFLKFAEEIFQLYLQRFYPDEAKVKYYIPIINMDYINERMVYINAIEGYTYIVLNSEDIYNYEANSNFKNYADNLVNTYKSNEYFQKLNIYDNIKLLLPKGKIVSIPIKDLECILFD